MTRPETRPWHSEFSVHLVHNPTGGFVTFLNVQGIGPYDYVPVGDQADPKFKAKPH